MVMHHQRNDTEREDRNTEETVVEPMSLPKFPHGQQICYHLLKVWGLCKW